MTTPAPRDTTEATAVRAIRALVEAKDLRAAKQQLRQLENRTDDATWAMIVEIANTLRFKTETVAVTKLRNLWRNNEQFRPLIEACVPKPGEHQYIPQPKPARSNNGPIVPRADKVRQDIDPNKRIAPDKRRRGPDTKIIDDYEKALTRGERDDPGAARAELIIDRHDYDLDAITGVPTTLCVSCRLERAAIDRHTERVHAGHGDDGLCGECRSLGRPGLPELAPGHTLTDRIHARLDFLAEHFPTSNRGIYRQEWRHATAHERPIISAWVKDHTHPEPEQPRTAPVTEKADLNGWCENCQEYRQLTPERPGAGKLSGKLCLDCDPHYQRPGFQAGDIEAIHNRYAEEIDGAVYTPGQQRSSDEGPRRLVTEESRTRQQPAPTEHGGVSAKSETTVPLNEHRRRLVESAREKARSVSQQRRRTMARQPATTARTRIVRRQT
ncbi:hypothetical protein ACIP5Y_00250 [Nocardia sp. NPDC088792]|uniref:hypothetical protein n=1 Tax=Nocardia sp. NPDC088792 TaxID=3364332 RepID=UPI00382888C1